MSRITPRLLVGFLIACIPCYALWFWLGQPFELHTLVREVGCAMAAAFCWKIAREYPARSPLAVAWLLLAAAALTSNGRHLIESRLFDGLANVHVYRQVAILLSLLFLLAGITAMARAFLRTGLGFSVHKGDSAAVAAIFATLSFILIMHGRLSEASFPLALSRNLQLAAQAVIATAGALSVVLHRLSVEMGGGRLAVAMRFIIAHIAIRVFLVVSNVIWGPAIFGQPLFEFLSASGFDIAIWVFAIGACYRAQMFATALRESQPSFAYATVLPFD